MGKFGFIGVGVMAGAMLQAALQNGVLLPQDCVLFDKYWGEHQENFLARGCVRGVCAQDVIERCEVVQLGTKPQDLPELLSEISSSLRVQQPLLISIAAGVLLRKFSEHTRAVRLMPNINATVGEAMTAFCSSEAVSPEECAFVERYCRCFGQAKQLEESKFSAFCALAGSAPAFVYLFADALANAGVAAGLPRALALEIATQTVKGSAVLIQESGTHPQQLANQVCSPAGTTIAGVCALQEHRFTHAVTQAVLAAFSRDRELSASAR